MSEEKRQNRQIHKVVIDAPIETVWNILVKTDEVLPFFFGSICETEKGLTPGSRIRMISPNKSNVAVVGEVLEFSPPHRYSHTLKFTQYDDPFCVVSYELNEVDGRVEFSLIQDQIPVGTKTEKSMSEGAEIICGTLKKLAETGKPGAMARMIMLMGPILGLLSPRQTRAENWPLDGPTRYR
ncbi:MAG: SRPBCC domain-containing protein [Pseudomonadota bacterium]